MKYKVIEIVILICTVSVVNPNSTQIPRAQKPSNAVSTFAKYVFNYKRQENDATPRPLPDFSELQDIATVTTKARPETSTRSTPRKSVQNVRYKSKRHSKAMAPTAKLSDSTLSKPTPTVSKVEDTTTADKMYNVNDDNVSDFLRDVQPVLPAIVLFLLAVVVLYLLETLYNYCRRRRRDEIPLS